MQRFPHIDLEAVMAAHDLLMYVVERTGPGNAAPIRVYPLNAASEIGYGNFRERQGRLIEEYIDLPEFVSFFREQWSPVLVEGQAQHAYSISYPLPSGEMREFSATIYQVEWTAEQALALVIGVDDTARRQAERKLHTAQERLDLLVANVPIVLFVIDQNGMFVLSEGKGLASLDLKPGQVVGRFVSDVYRDVPQILSDVQRGLTGETFVSVVSVAGLVFETWYAPMREQDGRLSGTIGVAFDVTSRVRMEEERLALQEQIIAAQAATLAELSMPLIPISDQIVVMPLIGAIDAQRSEQLLDTLLHGVSSSGARVAILDITGVPIVDTHIANALIRAAQAVRLLGTQIVLTGIRPEVAQTLISIGVDLQDIVTQSTLQSGIAYAMRRT